MCIIHTIFVWVALPTFILNAYICFVSFRIPLSFSQFLCDAPSFKCMIARATEQNILLRFLGVASWRKFCQFIHLSFSLPLHNHSFWCFVIKRRVNSYHIRCKIISTHRKKGLTPALFPLKWKFKGGDQFLHSSGDISTPSISICMNVASIFHCSWNWNLGIIWSVWLP